MKCFPCRLNVYAIVFMDICEVLGVSKHAASLVSLPDLVQRFLFGTRMLSLEISGHIGVAHHFPLTYRTEYRIDSVFVELVQETAQFSVRGFCDWFSIDSHAVEIALGLDRLDKLVSGRRSDIFATQHMVIVTADPVDIAETEIVTRFRCAAYVTHIACAG